MVHKILCVAEKPSIARAVAGHLGGRPRAADTRVRFIKNYSFLYNFPVWGGECEVIMTCVAGHLSSTDFQSNYRSWNSCDPEALFDAPIITFYEKDKEEIARNIERQARGAHALFIWTDCDREGEHIGTEIREVAWKANAALKNPGKVMRAKFSNIEAHHIRQAAIRPIPLDENQANAVAARIELDLRIGASFTRWQTLNIGNYLRLRGVLDDERKVISYGSCQFPTLGFVVDRYFMVKNFVPEPFWSIKVTHIKDEITVNFRWARNHLFDRMAVVILYERCLTAKYAKVVKVQTKPASKWKPLPLTTVELQKMGSRYLRMNGQTVMSVAESLYQKGWISYPRTETDQFDKGMDLRALVQKQTQGQTGWTAFAQGLMNGGFNQPRQGRNNDKAHPPIHPVNFVSPGALGSEDERKVHEFVVRRFLACCSEDAKGSRDEVGILWGSETFDASGLTVLARNYLDVYPYEKWTSTQQLPQYTVGETFEPTEANMNEGRTTPPGYLTEPDLIALMDANGIGTDATMAEHIAKIQERQYVMTRAREQRARVAADGDEGDEEGEAPEVQSDGEGGGRGGRGGRGRGGRGGRGGGRGGRAAPPVQRGVQEFIPTTLGVALVKGYENMGFETNLSKPFLRKEMEVKMKSICDGNITKGDVIQESLDMYRDVYIRTRRGIDILKATVDEYVPAPRGHR